MMFCLKLEMTNLLLITACKEIQWLIKMEVKCLVLVYIFSADQGCDIIFINVPIDINF